MHAALQIQAELEPFVVQLPAGDQRHDEDRDQPAAQSLEHELPWFNEKMPPRGGLSGRFSDHLGTARKPVGTPRACQSENRPEDKSYVQLGG